MTASVRRNLADAEVMETVEGYTLLRTDQNGWIGGAVVGGGGTVVPSGTIVPGGGNTAVIQSKPR